MRKNAVLIRYFTWIVLAALILVNVTPAASAPLTQNEIQVTPTPTSEPVIQTGVPSQSSLAGLKISGRITDAAQKPLAGVTIQDDQQHTTVSAADGTFLLADLKPGRYLVSAAQDGMVMIPYYRVIILTDKDAASVDFHQRQGGPAARLVPANLATTQSKPGPYIEKIPGKPWTPPIVGQPQPQGGDLDAQAAFSLGQPGLAFRYAGTYGTPEAGYPDDPAYINSPSGIFVDTSGNLWITESRGKRLLEYDSTPTRRLALGKRGVAFYGQSTFVNPQDVARDESGNIWMVDPNRLVEFDASGAFMRQFPDTNPGAAGAANNQFNNPSGIAFGDGLMYVADQGNQRIQVYVVVAGSPTYFRTIGETGVAGNDASHFNGPARVTFANHAIYVADLNNNRLVKCSLIAGTDFACSEFTLDGLVAHTGVALNMPTGIAFGSASLYVTDAGNFRVVKCDWDGSHAANCDHFKGVAGEPGTADDHFLWASDISTGPGDSVYISDSDNHRVQVFDASGILDTAHSIGAKDAGGNPAPYPTDAAHFNGPSGMVLVYESGVPYLYFTENLGQRLVKLNLNDTPPSMVWTVGQAGVYGADDHHLGSFWGGSLGNLDYDTKGRIYVPDTANHRLLIYLPNGSLWATMGETGVPGSDNQHFNQPAGVAVDSNNTLYVADSGNDRVQVFDSNRNYLATLGETGVAGVDSRHFNGPLGVSVDSSGNIFVADTNNQRVQKCILSGSSSSCLPFAGKTGVSAAGFDYLTDPTAVMVAQNEVYILDAGSDRVLVFDPTGAYRTTLAGDWGTRSGDMRAGLGIAVGPLGDVYVSDPVNQRIQKYMLNLPATADSPGWRQLNLNGFGKQYAPQVQAVVSFQGSLYAAADNSLTQAAELYRMDSNGNWSQVMNNGFGDAHNQAIDDLAVFNNVLYASTWNATSGGQLFSSTNGTTWTQVTLPGLDAWDAELSLMQAINGKLYIGIAVFGSGTPPHGARIFACDASGSCAKVFEAPSSTSAVLSMAAMGDWLYAGMASPAGGQVYRCLTTAGCAATGDWQQVFTDGNGSADNTRVTSLAVYTISGTDQLFAGVANAVSGARIYASACDDTGCPAWTQVNTNGFGSNQNADINALTVYGDPGKLLAMTQNETSGVQIWGYDGTNWAVYLPYPGFGSSTNASVYSSAGVTVFNRMMVVGTENMPNGGGVWASDPAAYTVTGTITGLSSGSIVYVGLYKNGVRLQNNQAIDTGGTFKFTFSGVLPGVYTITPFASSYSFAPRSWTAVKVDTADVNSGVDFSATSRPLPLIRPVDGARLDGQTTTLMWADLRAARYEYQVSYLENFSILYKTGKVTTPSVSLAVLPFNKTFFWRVRDASSTAAPGAWSAVWTFNTPDPPSVPVLVSPAANAFLQNLSPVFKWSASSGFPDHYRIQVSQSSVFSSLDLDENTRGAVTAYSLEAPLTPNRSYYWRVRSVSANGDFSAWSTMLSFKTYPETPWLVLPTDGVVASSLKPTFQWDDSLNTGAYQIQISTFGIAFKTVDLNARYYTLDTPLIPFLQYWWRVRAKGVGGYGSWSAVRVIYAPNPPGATTLLSPAVNAVVVGYQPVFTWNAVSGVPHYEIQVSSDFTFPVVNLRMDRYVDSASYDMSSAAADNLDSNRAYYWRVAACNAQYQCGNFTAARKIFTTPGIPALKSPDDLAPVSSLGVTFTWDDSPSPAQPVNANSFTLEIDKNTGCSGATKTFAVNARTFTTTLAKGAFFWHVKAAGVGGTNGASSWSTCRSFTVEVPPAAPAFTTPANNAVVKDYRNIEFTWQAPSPAPAGYELQVSRDSTFASVDLDNDTIGAGTSWAEKDLTDPYLWGGGKYFWRMRSKNADGLWGKWSANRAFTTLSTVYGYVTDAKTLLGLDGVTVDLLQGTGKDPIDSITTYDRGYFILHNVPKGSTTVRVSMAGYITTTQIVNITGPSQNLVNFGVVPVPAANQYSFVLSWPIKDTRNLDMHLWTPEGTKYAHIYSYNEGSISSSPFAHMDASNNTYNIEVITVDRKNLVAGQYELAVAQITPAASPTGSHARLEIYDDSGALVTGVGPYTIPSTGNGGWWHIFDFTKTADPLDFTATAPLVINTVQSASPAPSWADDKGIYGFVWLKDSVRGSNNINVTIDGSPVGSVTTARADMSGLFLVGGLNTGTYTVTPDVPGFTVNPPSQSVPVISGANYWFQVSNIFDLTPTSGINPGGEHRAIATQGHFTYLTSGASLDIYNIADKNNPELVKRLQPSMGKINDMVLAGNFAFLAAEDGLNVVDISDPANASCVGYYLDYGGLTGVAVKGHYAYLLYGWADLFVVDINDFILGTTDPNTGLPTPRYVSEFHIAGYGEKITISGNYAYIAYGDTGAFRGLYVVNIADPLHPQGIGFASVSGYPIEVEVSGNYAYLVGGVSYDYNTGIYTGGRLDVFDISNPSMPRQIDEMNYPDPVYNVKVDEGTAYLANGAGGVKILDARQPRFGVNLPLLSTFTAAYPAFCVDVLEKFAYVGSQDATVANSKMEIVSLANKAIPVLQGSIVPAP